MTSFDAGNSWVPSTWFQNGDDQDSKAEPFCGFGMGAFGVPSTGESLRGTPGGRSSLPRSVTITEPSSQSTTDWQSRERMSQSISNEVSAEEMLAKEMAQLSMKDRNAAYNDVHSVPDVIPETPEYLSQKFAEFDNELQRIAYKSVPYQRAQQQSPEYLQNKNFRLQFLRATDFDVPAAALRVHLFLNEKMELFGETKLTKEITQDDLSLEDMTTMESGAMQLLPLPDRGNRPVIFVNHSILTFSRLENYVSLMYCTSNPPPDDAKADPLFCFPCVPLIS